MKECCHISLGTGIGQVRLTFWNQTEALIAPRLVGAFQKILIKVDNSDCNISNLKFWQINRNDRQTNEDKKLTYFLFAPFLTKIWSLFCLETSTFKIIRWLIGSTCVTVKHSLSTFVFHLLVSHISTGCTFCACLLWAAVTVLLTSVDLWPQILNVRKARLVGDEKLNLFLITLSLKSPYTVMLKITTKVNNTTDYTSR